MPRAAIEQLQLACAGSVLYLDGGWQTIVDGLRRAAAGGGVRVMAGAQRSRSTVRRACHRRRPSCRREQRSSASAVILGGAPADVDALAARAAFLRARTPPVRVATLDVALRSLPKPNGRWRSVSTRRCTSQCIRPSPLWRRPGCDDSHLRISAAGRIGRTRRRARARGIDGYDAAGLARRLVSRQYLPTLTSRIGADRRDRGRQRYDPGHVCAAFDNVWIAGDWVGPHGQLSDAAAASASDAAAATSAALKGCARSPRGCRGCSLVSAALRRASNGQRLRQGCVMAQPLRDRRSV